MQGGVQKVRSYRELIKKAKLEREFTKRQAAKWKNREEQSSKAFYNPFKAGKEHQHITDLHITPNWSNPEVKEGTATDPSGLAECARSYYAHLSKDKTKETDPECAEELMKLYRQKQISKKTRDSIEGPIKKAEVRRAVCKMANGKFPGPDHIPAEFYKLYLNMIITDYTEVLCEAFEAGALPDSFLTGTIILLYKKGQERDPQLSPNNAT